jgi:hypothetical protein
MKQVVIYKLIYQGLSPLTIMVEISNNLKNYSERVAEVCSNKSVNNLIPNSYNLSGFHDRILYVDRNVKFDYEIINKFISQSKNLQQINEFIFDRDKSIYSDNIFILDEKLYLTAKTEKIAARYKNLSNKLEFRFLTFISTYSMGLQSSFQFMPAYILSSYTNHQYKYKNNSIKKSYFDTQKEIWNYMQNLKVKF